MLVILGWPSYGVSDGVPQVALVLKITFTTTKSSSIENACGRKYHTRPSKTQTGHFLVRSLMPGEATPPQLPTLDANHFWLEWFELTLVNIKSHTDT